MIVYVSLFRYMLEISWDRSSITGLIKEIMTSKLRKADVLLLLSDLGPNP
jgi:hypothetical protein